MVNFSQLQTFIAVVETGGFIAASIEIHRSQPSITNTIQKLEEQLGFTLFDRGQYRPQLTSKGEYFYQKAKEMMQEIARLNQSIALLQQGVESQFSIDLDISLPLSIHTSLIQSLINTYQDTCFSLVNNTFVQCIERLKNKACHICIAASDRKDPSIDYLPMPPVHMLALASKEYYDKHEKQINHPKCNNPCMQVMIANTEQELRLLSIEPLNKSMPKWLVSDMFTRKFLICSGLGIGRLPHHMVEEELKNGTLVLLDTDIYPSVVMSIYAMRLLHQEHGEISNHAWQAIKMQYTDEF